MFRNLMYIVLNNKCKSSQDQTDCYFIRVTKEPKESEEEEETPALRLVTENTC